MNTKLKQNLKNSSFRSEQVDMWDRENKRREASRIFFAVVFFVILFDLGMFVKSLILGTTWLGFVLSLLALAAEAGGLLFFVLPKFSYDYRLHVGGAILPVLFFLPVAGILADLIIFVGMLDILLLIIRIVLGVLFVIVYCSTEPSSHVFRVVMTVVIALISACFLCLGFVLKEDLMSLQDYSVRCTYANTKEDTVEITGFGEVSFLRKYEPPKTVNGKEVDSLGAGFADRITGTDTYTLPENIRFVSREAFSSNGTITQIVAEGELHDLDFACGNAIRTVSFPNGPETLPATVAATTASLDGLTLKLCDETYNEVRRSLFESGYGDLLDLLAPVSDELFCINFTTNCTNFLDSVLAPSAAEALTDAKKALSAFDASSDFTEGERQYLSDGWYTSPEFLKEEKVSDALSMDGNLLNLYKRWVPVYLLSFEEGEWEFDGAFSRSSFSALDEDFDLPQAVLEGYTFRGWYRDSEFTRPIETVQTLTVSEDLTLYPKFLENYAITYDWGKAEPVEDAPAFYHTEMSFDLPTLRADGYTFDGWYTNASFLGRPVSSVEEGRTGALELYAKFTPIVYTLTFETDGGSRIPQKTYTVEDETISLAQFSTARKGFSFVGWQDGEGTQRETWDTKSMQNATLTAKWSLAAFTGALRDTETQKTYGASVFLSADKSETGGWYAEDGEISYTYQWYRHAGSAWEEVDSATGSELTLSKVSESGTYTVGITAHYQKDSSQQEGGRPQGKAVTISPKVVEIEWTAPQNLEQNGEQKIPSAKIKNLEAGDVCNVTIELTAGDDNVNAGTFTYTAKGLEGADSSNYSLPEGDEAKSPSYTITPPASRSGSVMESLTGGSQCAEQFRDAVCNGSAGDGTEKFMAEPKRSALPETLFS